ncbi:protocatechuate 3,4-dioxygenase [Pseudomonas sp. App30]
MNPQVQGIEALGGTYVFDLRVSNRTLSLNRFLWKMVNAEWRARYERDPHRLMVEAGLNAVEIEMVTRQDWLGLVKYGANFFTLEKFVRVAKLNNMQVYAIMRGETYEAFLGTRKVPALR